MRVVDLFSGCGGMSKGFESAGFELALGIERWAPARKVYEENFHHPVIDQDLASTVDAAHAILPFKPDVLIGGPPCQDFSAAGMRIEGDRANLTLSFAEIICKVKPRWFVVENVIGLRTSKVWERSRNLLKEAGYGITESVLNASFFGVPQNRKRFFAVGRIGRGDGFLSEYLEQGKAERPLTVRDYLGDELGVEFYYRHPRNWGRKAIYSIDEPSATIRSTNRPVAPGYKPHPDDAGCNTVAKKLSPKQRSRLQTFPNDFKFVGTDTSQDMMIANAVPVNLAKHVASAILRCERDLLTEKEALFKAWLCSQQGYTNRTISNVLSRINRVEKILQINCVGGNAAGVIELLKRSDQYKQTSSSVRSQLKKALFLRSEYINNFG
ncbi:DNA cytosine methyltransferase [Pseudomonas sp. UBA4034]|uniref:DNA cytosine methyltransferase n=1 Tax=Pseudomonas sp. UBA4034 TaxID=1947315 RepID=UPI00257E1764|nr:DNA cytosine methyltransferase [Pseudomonas sp. UBA4034]